jgi:hypothetical protein
MRRVSPVEQACQLATTAFKRCADSRRLTFSKTFITMRIHSKHLTKMKRIFLLLYPSPHPHSTQSRLHPPGKTTPLFDGKTLAGWEGNAKLWRVEDGCLTGGSLTETVTHNDFLASTKDYTNFIVRFKIKLTGTEGFINSGFQIRSQRVPNNTEMAGYQCDFGEPIGTARSMTNRAATRSCRRRT